MAEFYISERKLFVEDLKQVRKVIRNFVESHELTIVSTHDTRTSIRARYYSGKQGSLFSLYYDYLWQIEKRREGVNVAFSLHIPLSAKVAVYSCLAFSGVLFLLSWSLFSIQEMNRMLGLQLAGSLLPFLPVLTLLRISENRMETFWREIEDKFPGSKIIQERKTTAPSFTKLALSMFVIVVATDLVLALLAVANVGNLNDLTFIRLFALFLALAIFSLISWPILAGSFLGEEFKSLKKLLQAGTISQVVTALPPILLLFGAQSLAYPSTSVASLGGALVLWVLILTLFWSISRSSPGEFIGLKIKSEYNKPFSSKLTPGSKVVLAAWLLSSLILLVGMPVTLILLGGNLSNLLTIPEKFGIPPSIVRIATALYLSPTLFMGGGLIRENTRTFFQTRSLLKEARNYRPDPDHEKKFKQIKELIEEEVKKLPANYRRVEVLPVDSDFLKCYSITTGVVRYNGYIFLSTAVLKGFSLQELKALTLHEVHHLKHDSSLLAKLRILSKLTIFGNGFLAGVIDFKAREFLADKYAAKKAGLTPLTQALRKFRRKKVATKIAERSLGFSFTRRKEQRSKKRSNRFARIYQLLFKNYIPFFSHPTIEERINFIENLG